MRKLEVSSTMPASIESTGIKNADTEVGEDRSHLRQRLRIRGDDRNWHVHFKSRSWSKVTQDTESEYL